MKNFDIIVLSSFLIILGLLGFEINSLAYGMPPHGFVSEEGDSYEERIQEILGLEHRPSPTEAVGRDPFALIGYLAARSQELVLATGIANIYARDAMTTKAVRKTIARLQGG